MLPRARLVTCVMQRDANYLRVVLVTENNISLGLNHLEYYWPTPALPIV